MFIADVQQCARLAEAHVLMARIQTEQKEHKERNNCSSEPWQNRTETEAGESQRMCIWYLVWLYARCRKGVLPCLSEFSADFVSKEPDGSVVSADVGALQPRPFASWTAFGFLHKNLVNRIWVTCSCLFMLAGSVKHVRRCTGFRSGFRNRPCISGKVGGHFEVYTSQVVQFFPCQIATFLLTLS